jgi:hypothetical protein
MDSLDTTWVNAAISRLQILYLLAILVGSGYLALVFEILLNIEGDLELCGC